MLTFTSITPEDVLYFFNEPLIFLTRTESIAILCMKVDEELEYSKYLCVPSSPHVADKLRTGKFSLRSAFFQPWCWLIDADTGFQVLASEGMSAEDVPPYYIPKEGIGLFPHVDASPTEEQTPFMQVKFRGGQLHQQSINIDTVKQLLDDVHSYLKTLFSPIVQAASSTALSSLSLSRALRFSIREPQFASLSIQIERPTVDLSRAKKVRVVDSKETDDQLQSASEAFIRDAGLLLESARSDAIESQYAYGDSTALEALVRIAPSDQTSFEFVEISAKALDGTIHKVTIDSDQGRRIKRIHDQKKLFSRQITGTIVLHNSISDTFVLQTREGRQITCLVSPEAFEAAKQAYVDRSRVMVSGDFERRSRRDRLYVRSIATT